jgi:cell wall-associated NlpC family hydrolase
VKVPPRAGVLPRPARAGPGAAPRSGAAALLGLALLSGCALFRSGPDSLRADIVETALDQVGEDYRYGGASPSEGFDCSGLVYYSYAENGIRLPRSAAAQHKAGRHVNFSEALPADLLFYHFGDRKKTDLHVALYLGDGKAVHAPVRDGEVAVIDVTQRHWRSRYVGARRIVAGD